MLGFLNKLKTEEMLEHLKYVKSVEKEVDDLKMEIDDLKSQLETEKQIFQKSMIYSCKDFSKKIFCVLFFSLWMIMMNIVIWHANILTKWKNVNCGFGNDQFAPILGYRDLVQGDVTIKRIYYVEGLNHNLFSVGQFCDADLEVVFRKSTCFVRDLQGNNLLTVAHGSNLYTIALQEYSSPTLICFIAKASSTHYMVIGVHRTDEAKDIKEAMVDHAWIEAMQEELNQFDRLSV
ncbi:hypothetical protein Tco_1093929 [Tanacetum coccineum]|uniref:Integrase, catalytic region, zinc finger, CCHC-type, peptidase aspartic, catalytic n=1 Tax=Tanacetum coccineum TaxID=301880 RepID=A0ABQ5IFB9_9ASTR